jgi:hypothetical protein
MLVNAPQMRLLNLCVTVEVSPDEDVESKEKGEERLAVWLSAACW